MKKVVAILLALLIVIPAISVNATETGSVDSGDYTNVALGKTTSASSGEKSSSYAVDGDEGSRWESEHSDNQWIYVDLEETTKIYGVEIIWETAAGKDFTIDVSDDGTNWITIEEMTDGTGGTQVFSFDEIETRYVKMNGVTRTTGYGFSIFEFKVFGVENQTDDPSEETINDNYKEDFEVTVQNVKTGKFLSITGPAYQDGVSGSVTADAELGDEGTVFKMEYTTFDGAARVNVRTTTSPTLRLAEFWDLPDGVGASVLPTDKSIGGWESVSLEAQGDGTISIRSGRTPQYYLGIDDEGHLKVSGVDNPTDAEKFVIITTAIPPAVSNITFTGVTDQSVTINWGDLPLDAVFTGYEVYRSTSNNGIYTKIGEEMIATSFTDDTVERGTTYYYYVKTVNAESPSNESGKASVTTASSAPPTGGTTVSVKHDADGIKITWETVEGATGYNLSYADGKYSEYNTIASNITSTTYTVSSPNISKYAYFKVQPLNDGGASDWSEAISLENMIFGDNMYFFSPKDDVSDVNSVLGQISEEQIDAQFGTGRYSAYFKPGDYSTLDIIKVGYYTHIGGLGKTPYDTQLSNLETPTPAGFDNNATCTFWRSAENFTVLGTANGTGWHAENFNWGVSQASPLRRINALKDTWFQWNYGNASGGYAADSLFATTPKQGSQQQYYVRNSKITSTNPTEKDAGWNLVYQGMDADLPASNWVLNDGDKQWGNITNIENTPIIKEKPFLYYDETEDEYKVFVPTWRENSIGVSWSQNNMGDGYSLSVEENFYIAKADTDTSETINAALDEGKHIFFTPGMYFLDEPIHVKKKSTIVLGTGYATLIPSENNSEGAIRVDDVEDVIVASLLFDAHYSSKYLVKVGEKGVSNDHSENPILLVDLFYRVGGFRDANVHVDVCLEVNSDNLINDHCWVWRADHGDAVGWYRNTCPNGIIVNGDHVTFYGTMVEHFQEYEIIWNGDYGRNYFLQNETPYDVPTQEAYMSHGGTVNGYATYKVSNDVQHHYAVGLGIYDVLINNYKNQDENNGIEVGGDKSSILIANAIEVPHAPSVVIENACVVSISDEHLKPRGTEHIINGIGVGTQYSDIGTRYQIVKFENGIGYGVDNIEINGAVEPLDEVLDATNKTVIEVGDTEVILGEALSVGIKANSSQEIYAEEIAVIFNPQYLVFGNIVSSDETKYYISDVILDEATGDIKLIIVQKGQPLEGEDILFTINFTSKIEGTTSVSIVDAVFTDGVGNEYVAELSSVQINIVDTVKLHDLNGDAKESIADLGMISKNYGIESEDLEWNDDVEKCDLDNNGIIDSLDFDIMISRILY
ncbi:discoidin domain-containing protein [Vallitalea okinawensis]|uniref:discoidin domain-containing protein n=1 Tax=Vallitalea okinawensis TaxID=2078660 RepID=UPI000CFE1221|nr:discoidin domain-containing protein [Vallitalea okinawensis]